MSQSLPPALLLAAGVGRRLGQLTMAMPKSLLEVNGLPLLERSLRALEATGFADAIIVTGHAAPILDGFVERRSGDIRVRTVFTPSFAQTNNIVSLLAAGEWLRQGFCLLNTDIIFDASVLVDVRARSEGVWLVVDGDEPLGAEEMKVELDAGGRVRRISKNLDPQASYGEYIGIVRFDAHGAEVVLREAEALVAAGNTDLYYEDAIDRAAAELEARIIATDRRAWTEVDDVADYERAQRVASTLDAAGIDA